MSASSDRRLGAKDTDPIWVGDISFSKDQRSSSRRRIEIDLTGDDSDDDRIPFTRPPNRPFHGARVASQMEKESSPAFMPRTGLPATAAGLTNRQKRPSPDTHPHGRDEASSIKQAKTSPAHASKWPPQAQSSGPSLRESETTPSRLKTSWQEYKTAPPPRQSFPKGTDLSPSDAVPEEVRAYFRATCMPCFYETLRCDGQRPQCAKCVQRGIGCLWYRQANLNEPHKQELLNSTDIGEVPPSDVTHGDSLQTSSNATAPKPRALFEDVATPSAKQPACRKSSSQRRSTPRSHQSSPRVDGERLRAAPPVRLVQERTDMPQTIEPRSPLQAEGALASGPRQSVSNQSPPQRVPILPSDSKHRAESEQPAATALNSSPSHPYRSLQFAPQDAADDLPFPDADPQPASGTTPFLLAPQNFEDGSSLSGADHPPEPFTKYAVTATQTPAEELWQFLGEDVDLGYGASMPSEDDLDGDNVRSLERAIHSLKDNFYVDVSEENLPKKGFNLDALKKVLQHCKQQLYAFQEDMVMSLLNKAKIDCSQRPLAPRMSTSPFAGLKPSPGLGEKMDLLVKSYGPGASSQKWTSKSAPITVATSREFRLPRYRSIGRLGTNVLSKNVVIGKSIPYDPDDEELTEEQYDEKSREHNERYQAYEAISHHLHDQRKCAEVADLWFIWIEMILEQFGLKICDIVRFYLLEREEIAPLAAEYGISKAHTILLEQERVQVCGSCRTDPFWKILDNRKSILPKLDRVHACPPQAVITLGVIAHVLRSVSAHGTGLGIALWHLAFNDPSILEIMYGSRVCFATLTSEQLCLVCGLHQCPMHGAYREHDVYEGSPSDDDEGRERDVNNQVDNDHVGQENEICSEMFINNAEHTRNDRQTISLPERKAFTQSQHICGVWCTESATREDAFRGRKDDGTLVGLYRTDMEKSGPIFQDDQLCSRECFWDIERRSSHAVDELDPLDWRIFNSNLSRAMTNLRGPCLMRQLLPHITCVTLFVLMVQKTRNPPHPSLSSMGKAVEGGTKYRSKSSGKRKAAMTVSNYNRFPNRPTFVPCNHDGPCEEGNGCPCAEARVQCEHFCGCDGSCRRRFRGCKCRPRENGGACGASCECRQHSRECDPWLCRSCGVDEVLNPSNRDSEELRRDKCQNCDIQLAIPAKTIKAPSEVQGFGLFAGADIAKDQFIGEYAGEIISTSEGNRRGARYSNDGAEYMFKLNANQEIDGSLFGNKMRFINNSRVEGNINAYPGVTWSGLMPRIVLRAKRNIKAGEELLFYYAYPERTAKKFWERGEKPPMTKMRIQGHDAVIKQASPTIGRSSNPSGNSQASNYYPPDEEDPSQSPVARRTQRRLDHDGPRAKIRQKTRMVEVSNNDVDDEDYEDSSQGSEGSSSTDESEQVQESSADEEAEEAFKTPVRPVGSMDRRLGGEAQRKAYATRRRNESSLRGRQGRR